MKKTITIALGVLALSGAAFAADAKAGAAVYEKSCKGCHGATGEGNPAIAKMLSATIPALGSAAVQGESDADLTKVITEGKGKMKAVKSVTAPADVVAYIRTLKK